MGVFRPQRESRDSHQAELGEHNCDIPRMLTIPRVRYRLL